MRIGIVLLFLITGYFNASAKGIYVSVNGKDSNKGNHWFVPLKTIQKAYDQAQPGDTLYLMNGSYSSNSEATLNITKGGKPDHWIVIKNYLKHRPLILSGSQYAVKIKSAGYISFEGLEFMQDTLKFKNPGVVIEGIRAEGIYEDPCSHIKISDCHFSKFTGSALHFNYFDHVVLGYSKFYKNAAHSDAKATIYFRHYLQTDDQQSFHLTILSNVAQANGTETVNNNSTCNPVLYIDYNQSDFTQKQKSILISNNIWYVNGGGGMILSNVTGAYVVNNTLYKNAELAHCRLPEIRFERSSYNMILNNIMFTSSAKPANEIINSLETRFRNNLYYNYSSIDQGENDLIAHPEFELIDQQENLYNFRLQASSPAINAGTDEFLLDQDYEGHSRKNDLHVDIGALEFKNRILPSLKNLAAGPQSKGLASSWTSLYLKDQLSYTLWNQQGRDFVISVFDQFGSVIYTEIVQALNQQAFELDFSRYGPGLYGIIASDGINVHKDRIYIVPKKSRPDGL